jgi:hypothetical protein
MPILIVIVLGAIFAVAFRGRNWPFWAKALAAAFLATAIWGLHVPLLILLASSTNDQDSNTTHLFPILMTFFIALVPALLISLASRKKAGTAN